MRFSVIIGILFFVGALFAPHPVQSAREDSPSVALITHDGNTYAYAQDAASTENFIVRENILHWKYNPAGAPSSRIDWLGLLKRAADHWNTLGIGPLLVYDGETTAIPGICSQYDGAIIRDGQTTIGWGQNTDWPVLSMACLLPTSDRGPSGHYGVDEVDIWFHPDALHFGDYLEELPKGCILQDENCPPSFEAIAMHEFGHAFGILPHAPEKHCDLFAKSPIMCAVARQHGGNTPNGWDIHQLMALYRSEATFRTVVPGITGSNSSE